MLGTISTFFVGKHYDSELRFFEERCVDEYLNSKRRATRTQKQEDR